MRPPVDIEVAMPLQRPQNLLYYRRNYGCGPQFKTLLP